MIVRINSTQEMREYGERFGGLVAISTAANLAGVSCQRIRHLVQVQQRLTDVRLFGLQMVNFHELDEWMTLRERQRPRVTTIQYNVS